MNDAAFSKSEAFRFGWETAKGNIGFFIWVILAGYVLPTAITSLPVVYSNVIASLVPSSGSQAPCWALF